MKKLTALAMVFLLTLSSVACAADMNYNLTSPHLRYERIGEGEGMPTLVDETRDGEANALTAQESVIDAQETSDDGETIWNFSDATETIADAPQQESAQITWPQTFTVTVAGDTTLGSTDDLRKRDDCFERVAEEKGYAWFFSGLYDLFSGDDLTLINFEGTLTEETRKNEKLFNFKGPAEYADIVTLGGVEAVNIANNHTKDYGDQGYEDTIANLEAANLIVSGGGKLGIFEKNGVKVGMTGYSFPFKDGKKDISSDVKKLREMGCQIVIASFHWGSEYRDDFTADQRNIGRAALRAGADIVVGHHPHIVQGIEAYQDSYILYSLGNLVFGGNVDPDDRDAYAARLTFTVYEDHADAPRLTIVPLRLTELSKGTDYRPVLAQGDEAQRIVNRILIRSSNMSGFVNGEL